MNKILILFFLIIVNIFASGITAIPTNIAYDKNKALLGKKLFFDTRLSKNNTISCATCHDLKNGGDDGLKFSFGIDGQEGSVNAPTVLNAVFNFRQFWDGRAKNLKEQALGPVENPIEMGHNFKDLVKELKNTEYEEIFSKIYDDGITKDNIADSIAEFEKTLITPNSRFDRFLKGDKDALSDFEKQGYEIFKMKGCIACHHGRNVGGNSYNRFGVIVDVKNNNLGRYNITKDERDKYNFKVPSLRSIELTSPYFNDGRVDTLKEAVETMSEVQLGRPISEDEVEKIVAFLKTLTADVKIIE
ncbi:MAG: cytochrome-c peroxidase [Halarcobacter sp.]